jgi:hypothetical protein
MTDAEMALEVHAHLRNRELEAREREERHVDDILSSGGTLTDAAALDAAKEVLEDGGDIEDVIAAAVQSYREMTATSAEATNDVAGMFGALFPDDDDDGE